MQNLFQTLQHGTSYTFLFIITVSKYIFCFQLIESACEETDERVEPQPLWEYPAKARGQPICLLTLDLTTTIPDSPVICADSITLPGPGIVNGMALWADWHMTDQPEDILTTGPTQPVVFDQYVSNI